MKLSKTNLCGNKSSTNFFGRGCRPAEIHAPYQITGCSLKTLYLPRKFFPATERTRRFARPRGTAAFAANRAVEIKISIAKGTDKLDLSELDLTDIPDEVFSLENLQELSLAGNRLQSLPPRIGELKSLQRLQLSGNQLDRLPAQIGLLSCLEGLWLHGNLLSRLPDEVCELGSLRVLSLAGNRLEELPQGIGALSELEELSAPGNLLRCLPESVGGLKRLRKLALHGNQLDSLPSSIGGLERLKELWLMGNQLTEVPSAIGALASLRELSLADNALCSAPEEIRSLEGLQSLWLYGNRLPHFPCRPGDLPSLKHLWVEGNPLADEESRQLVEGIGQAPQLRALGLDMKQVAALGPQQLEPAAAAEVLQVSRIAGRDVAAGECPPRGYFKLSEGRQLHKEGSPKVLVVAFGSAPGVPNWAGLLRRVAREAEQAVAGKFDVLYVVDPCRSWYGGGDSGADAYRQRLSAAVEGYDEVVMIGDSMGATAALLFSELATHVHSFCPQVDLARASIRPGMPERWLAALRDNLLAAVEASPAQITVHCGNWQHDLDQAVIVEPRADLRVYDVYSHRLAVQLDAQGRLLPIIRDTVFAAMRDKSDVRLSNLL
uniref:Leucine rich repeat protein n=1 Tax=Tetraselmis sp. GSL018 TaxID=582737 RepID=A0A061RCG5_9CHLO